MDNSRAVVINSTTLSLGRVTAIGGIMTILSGIGMVAVLHGAVDSQLWFRIKMIPVLLIIINSVYLARPQTKKLKNLLSTDININADKLGAVKRKMNIYHLMQLTILVIIFVLSIFKFN